jgi:hypothetical protein
MSQSCLPDGIIFSSQMSIDSFQINYPGCTVIEGDVDITGNITNLNGLSVLTRIEGVLWCTNDDTLLNFNGLNNLESVGGLNIAGFNRIVNMTGFDKLSTIEGLFFVSFNDSIINFSGLNSLVHVGSSVSIGANPKLTDLSGFENLESIEGFLSFNHNDSLSDLTSLENLTTINGGISINDNDRLYNLYGLDNISSASITSIDISENNNLSICNIKSICNYLATSNANIVIQTNSSGCMSQIEVEEACTVGIPNNIKDFQFVIYPNPACSILFISRINGFKTIDVTIYNLYGHKILQKQNVTDKVDVSSLDKGFYIIELVSNNLKIQEKLTINK